MHYRYFIEENPEKFLKKNKKDTVTTKSMKKLKTLHKGHFIQNINLLNLKDALNVNELA